MAFTVLPITKSGDDYVLPSTLLEIFVGSDGEPVTLPAADDDRTFVFRMLRLLSETISGTANEFDGFTTSAPSPSGVSTNRIRRTYTFGIELDVSLADVAPEI